MVPNTTLEKNFMITIENHRMENKKKRFGDPKIEWETFGRHTYSSVVSSCLALQFISATLETLYYANFVTSD